MSGKQKGSKMSLDVSAKLNNVDRSVLMQVSKEIMKRANANNQNVNFDVNSAIAKFQAPKTDLGLNLYNKGVDIHTANQVALNNSGLQIHLNQTTMAAIQALNTHAAVKSATPATDGRVTFGINEGFNTIVAPENPSITQGILSFATDKDKHGSETPYRGEFLFIKKDEENAA